MPHLEPSVPLLCKGETLFPATCHMSCLRRSLPISPLGIQDFTGTLLFCAENCQVFITRRGSPGTQERNGSFALLRHAAGGREWDFPKAGIAQLEITAFKVVTFLCMEELS